MSTINNVSTIRPGLLVSVGVTCRGNISYSRNIIEQEHLTKDGREKAKWETESTVADPEEYKRALEVQSKALKLIRGTCIWSAFGLLCPEVSKPDLDKAIVEAKKLCAVFNATSSLTQVRCYVLMGRIAENDAEAITAINGELRGLLKTMQEGIENVDVKKIRDAANKSRELGAMLSTSASEKIKEAIQVARSAASKIVKAGEAAAQIVDRDAINAIARARTAFLDMDDDQAQVGESAAQSRAIDLESEEQVVAPVPKRLASQLEIEDSIKSPTPPKVKAKPASKAKSKMNAGSTTKKRVRAR